MAFSFGEEDDDDGDDELDELDEDRLVELDIGGGTSSSCAGCVPSTTTCADLSSPLAFALCASFICSILSGVAYLLFTREAFFLSHKLKARLNAANMPKYCFQFHRYIPFLPVAFIFSQCFS